MPNQPKGLLDDASPKLTFILGLALGIGALSIIGFVVLLTQDGGTKIAVAPTVETPTAKAAAPAPTPQPAPQPTDNGSVQNMAAITENDHLFGDPNAAITLVEYSDLECPFCQRFYPTVKDVVEKYDGQVNWVYRHFPLRSIHADAAPAAEASECVTELAGNDAFWNFVDRLFANGDLSSSGLAAAATGVGVNGGAFTECVDSGRHAQTVRAQEQNAVASGGQGTPYSIIVKGDTRVPLSGALPAVQIESIIDQLLAE